MSFESNAYAKVNLSLEVIGKRSDGFHELISVMQTVNVADVLRFRPDRELRLCTSDPHLPTDNNLVFAAASLIRRTHFVEQGCAVELEKHIPVGAGLGGGSSDAASALTTLNKLWNLSASCSQLRSLAEQIGSDVPFFLYGGTCLVQGRGERVTTLPEPRPTCYLLVKPPIAVSTAAIYQELSSAEWSRGMATRDVAIEISNGRAPRLGHNSLQDALFRLYPEAETCFSAVRQVAGEAIVSGSGPTVVSSFSSAVEATEAKMQIERLHEEYWTAVATSCVPAHGSSPCR
jgi:4-diphosphocytidyl-2-C-methyl-D-erythritol kinase